MNRHFIRASSGQFIHPSAVLVQLALLLTTSIVHPSSFDASMLEGNQYFGSSLLFQTIQIVMLAVIPSTVSLLDEDHFHRDFQRLPA